MKTILLIAIITLLSGCYHEFEICSEFHGRIDETTECIPDTNFTITSGGGRINTAIKMANMTTYTHVERYCASSCVLISSRGDERSACHDVRYGFHQATGPYGTSQVILFFLEDDRVDHAAVTAMVTSTPNDDVYYIDAYMAQSFGLVDEVVDCS